MFVRRNIQNFEVPAQISLIFQPTRKYHSVHEKLWLLTMLGADVRELLSFARIQKNPHARRNLTKSQAGRQAIRIRSPQVQRRVNFEPTIAEANGRQSLTSYIIPPTPAVGVHSAVDQL